MTRRPSTGNPSAAGTGKGYLAFARPSPWVMRFAPLVTPGDAVLDLACGNGRQGRALLARGHAVTFVDRDTGAVADLATRTGAEIVRAELEDGSPWPLPGRRFAAVIGVNYLHRPLFPALMAALEPGGLLLYDTFARGHEVLGRPRNPDHLLKSGELLDLVKGTLTVIAYEHGLIDDLDCPGIKQRICALRADIGPEGEPMVPPLPQPAA